MKRKYVCPGCKRTEYIHLDKIKLLKHLEPEKFNGIILDIKKFLADNLYTKKEGMGIAVNINMRQLFVVLTKKYGIDETVTFIFHNYVSSLTKYIIRKDTPLEMIEKMEERKS